MGALLRHREQIEASDPGRSAWVSAHAGSGKTFILIDRFLRLLLSGVEPEKILCLTFTRAAAAEMTERLHEWLGRWAVCDDLELAADIRALEEEPDEEKMARARELFSLVVETRKSDSIQTIHAFCQSVLKRFPIEADLSPAFKVMDAYTTQAMLKEARERMLDNQVGNLAVLDRLAAHFEAEGFDQIFSEMMDRRKEISAALEGYEEKMRMIAERWGVAYPGDSDKIKERIITERPVADLRRAAELMENYGGKSDKEKGQLLSRQLQFTRDWHDRHDRLGKLDRLEDYLSLFYTKARKLQKRVCHKASGEEAKAILEREQRRVDGFIQEANKIESLTCASMIAGLAREFLSLFEQLKREQAFLDYDDLIEKVLALFSTKAESAWVLYRLDGGLEHILIDEAQDTNPRQWELIRKLSEEFFAGEGSKPEVRRTLFAVGDAKQSIFSFQGAAPEGFFRMGEVFGEKATVARRGWRELSLTRSFRSVPVLLAAVDRVFEGLRLSSDEQGTERLWESHQSDRARESGLVEVWPLFNDAEEKHNEERLAEAIAGKIAGLMKQKQHAAEDFLILVRRRNHFVDCLMRALRGHGLPHTGSDRLKLNEHIAILDLLSLTRFTLLPRDDLSLAEILKSPIGNLSESDLMALSLERKEKKSSLWQVLSARREEFPALVERLSHCLRRADFIRPFDFFSELLEARHLRADFLNVMGEEVNDPLDAFLNLALLYEESHTPSLQGFLEWFTQTPAEIKRDIDREKDKIRIMTIHGAKGLEAKIVFLVDIPFHPASTYWLPLKRQEVFIPFWKMRDLPVQDIEEMEKRNQWEEAIEENRLFYVGMTRARDQLHLCGYKNKGDRGLLWFPKIDGLFDKTPPPEAKPPRVLREEKDRADRPSWIEDMPNITEKQIPLLTPSALPSALADKGRRAVFSPLEKAVPDEAALLGSMTHEALRASQTHDESSLTTLLQKRFADHPQSSLIAVQARRLSRKEGLRWLFERGRSEVAVQALLGEPPSLVRISGKIDRLILDEEEQTATIIDYKTDSRPPAKGEPLPSAYERQLAAYAMALAKIRPGWQIRAAILWTAAARLDWMDEKTLENQKKMIILDKGEI